MAYNFEEQDQLDNLKSFWNRYGMLILTAVTAVAMSVAGYRLWGWYQQKQATEAASAYAVLQQAASESDQSRVRAAEQTLRDAHESSIYASMGALVGAKAHFDAGDTDAAATSLQWIIDNAPASEFAPVARIRLAGVLLDQGRADAGLALLDTDTMPEAFRPLAHDRRGDLLASLARNDEALAAWEMALADLPPNTPLRRTVELKRDALKVGG